MNELKTNELTQVSTSGMKVINAFVTGAIKMGLASFDYVKNESAGRGSKKVEVKKLTHTCMLIGCEWERRYESALGTSYTASSDPTKVYVTGLVDGKLGKTLHASCRHNPDGSVKEYTGKALVKMYFSKILSTTVTAWGDKVAKGEASKEEYDRILTASNRLSMFVSKVTYLKKVADGWKQITEGEYYEVGKKTDLSDIPGYDKNVNDILSIDGIIFDTISYEDFDGKAVTWPAKA